MDEYYFSVNIDEKKILCLAPLTDRRLENADILIDNTSGHFLFEQIGSGENAVVRILAHVLSEESVFQLREMFKMS